MNVFLTPLSFEQYIKKPAPIIEQVIIISEKN